MPRVVRIHNRLIIGGPAINVTYLTRYMAPEFETTLIIGGKDDHEQDATHLSERLDIQPIVVQEMRRAIHPINDGRAYQKVKELIDKFKPDIVHTHGAKSGIIGRKAAEAAKVPVIIHTYHGHVFHSYFSKWQTDSFIMLERYLAKRSTGIIALSEKQKTELSDTYNICPREKIRIIPLGLDLDLLRFNDRDNREQFRSQYGIKENEVAIGIIGRIVPVKNHTLFVNAAAKLLAKTEKKVRFIIIGDGEMRAQMEREFEIQKVSYSYYPSNPNPSEATAVCVSWQHDIALVLAGLDIVALTSHNEGTPLSLIEAQAAAKPVVSTDVGGVSDIIVPEKSGYVTPPDDAEAMADALQKLVESPEKRREFGETGRKFVNANFSYKRLVSDMSQYYYELLEHHDR